METRMWTIDLEYVILRNESNIVTKRLSFETSAKLNGEVETLRAKLNISLLPPNPRND